MAATLPNTIPRAANTNTTFNKSSAQIDIIAEDSPPNIGAGSVSEMALLEAKNKDGKFYFLTRYGHKPHTSFDYSDNTRNIYLVFGKESTGIPKEILKDHLNECARIPINSNIRALNLSNCVALVLFEALRQQDYPNLLRTEPFKGEDYLEN